MSYRTYQFPHTVTVWRPIDDPDVFGKSCYDVFSVPCRFEERERLYTNEFGQHERANGVVYTQTRLLKKGDLVAFGDYQYERFPIADTYEIKNERHISNMRGTKTEHRYTF